MIITRATLLFVVVALLWSVSACEAEKQAVLDVKAAGLKVEDPRPKLRIWRDNSTSMDEQSLGTFLPKLRDGVADHSLELAGVEVVEFSTGKTRLADAPVTKYLWGPLPSEGAGVINDPSQPLSVYIFRSSKSAADKFAQEKISALTEKYFGVVREKLEGAIKHLEKIPASPAPCTRFGDLQNRLTEEDEANNLILTDGWVDCKDDKSVPRSMKGRLLIILFATNSDDGAERKLFEERRQAMEKFFPQAQIIAPYMGQAALEQILSAKP